uniref:Uncharacterized protein n=1 Tax=Pyramimonas orientalis virus TaxID=455367 RepID=A0A7L9AYL6_POV01|nr:hypothetical protein HWQ62_00173 [Pyramimonas orientalis virus]
MKTIMTYITDTGEQASLTTNDWRNIDEKPILFSMIYSQHVIEQILEHAFLVYYSGSCPLLSNNTYDLLKATNKKRLDRLCDNK